MLKSVDDLPIEASELDEPATPVYGTPIMSGLNSTTVSDGTLYIQTSEGGTTAFAAGGFQFDLIPSTNIPIAWTDVASVADDDYTATYTYTINTSGVIQPNDFYITNTNTI